MQRAALLLWFVTNSDNTSTWPRVLSLTAVMSQSRIRASCPSRGHLTPFPAVFLRFPQIHISRASFLLFHLLDIGNFCTNRSRFRVIRVLSCKQVRVCCLASRCKCEYGLVAEMCRNEDRSRDNVRQNNTLRVDVKHARTGAGNVILNNVEFQSMIDQDVFQNSRWYDDTNTRTKHMASGWDSPKKLQG